jgi:hypothetical protein
MLLQMIEQGVLADDPQAIVESLLARQASIEIQFARLVASRYVFNWAQG